MTGQRSAHDATRERRLRAWLARETPEEVPASLSGTLARLRAGTEPVVRRVTGSPRGPRSGRRLLAGLAAAVVLALAAVGTGLLAMATQRQPAASPSTSSAATSSPPASPSAVTPAGVSIGTPVLIGQQTGIKAALADTASGPVVSVFEAEQPGPLASPHPSASTCPPSPVGIVGASSVAWATSDQSILSLAGDASATGPVGVGFAPDCSQMTILAPTSATSWASSLAPAILAGGPWYLGMKPGHPQTVVAWSPATGQLAQKGGFLSWTTDGGRTWTSGLTDPAMPAGWDAAGAYWQIGPGGLEASRGPGYAPDLGTRVATDVTWDPTAGQVPPLMASGVFRDRVLLAVRDASLESVATDASGIVRVPIATWRISTGSRFVAVEGRELTTGAPTLAVSSDGIHFVTRALPAEFAQAPTESVALLALDDRVLVTDWPQTSNPADQVIHVWSVPVTGAPAPPPSPSPYPTPAIPSPPPAEVTSTWTPVTLPQVPINGTNGSTYGGPQGGIASLPTGGFIDFVPASPTHAVVFTSADGARWTQVGEVTGTDAHGITGPVGYDGHTYVALGTEPGGQGSYGMQQNGAAWVSSDLRTWTEAPVQNAFGGAGMQQIVSGPTGFVAIGYQESLGTAAWRSPDGLHWSGLSPSELSVPDGDFSLQGIARTASGLVMVGSVGQAPASWTSPDGVHWTVHTNFPGGDGATYLRGLVATSGGLLAVGSGAQQIEVAPGDFRSPVSPWTSPDGVTWTAHTASPALFGAGPTIVAAPGGFVAAGGVGGGQSNGLWTSRDGLDWTPVAGVRLDPADQLQLLSDGQHVLLVENGQSGLTGLRSSGVMR